MEQSDGLTRATSTRTAKKNKILISPLLRTDFLSDESTGRVIYRAASVRCSYFMSVRRREEFDLRRNSGAEQFKNSSEQKSEPQNLSLKIGFFLNYPQRRRTLKWVTLFDSVTQIVFQKVVLNKQTAEMTLVSCSLFPVSIVLTGSGFNIIKS